MKAISGRKLSPTHGHEIAILVLSANDIKYKKYSCCKNKITFKLREALKKETVKTSPQTRHKLSLL